MSVTWPNSDDVTLVFPVCCGAVLQFQRRKRNCLWHSSTASRTARATLSMWSSYRWQNLRWPGDRPRSREQSGELPRMRPPAPPRTLRLDCVCRAPDSRNPRFLRSSDENKVIRIAKCDVFSGACESVWYLRAFRCESLYAVYMETAASYLSSCRAAVGLYRCSVAWLHVRNCQHRTDYSVVTMCLQIQNCVAYIIFCWSNTVDC